MEASVGVDLVSGYVWRGQDLGGVSLQPAVSVAYKGFSLEAWGLSLIHICVYLDNAVVLAFGVVGILHVALAHNADVADDADSQFAQFMICLLYTSPRGRTYYGTGG